MIWWWIGNAVFLLVVIPVVLFLLDKLRRPVTEIRDYVDDTLEHGVLAIAALDAVDDLVETRDQVKELKAGVLRYGDALDDVL
ncbi:MAG: hypothetical protein KY437_04520 [Actinobacteria bacterium]|nr:hypothetical protein [Actinomycetota bacterium]